MSRRIFFRSTATVSEFSFPLPPGRKDKMARVDRRSSAI
ncbi:hypothetical protein BLSMQ_3084 [Brevibacterium aurantiacum]|uniref:Uncharacterized protein n=1 Tax=Brevibacterium aurantiacum TaxID=273384 RepID=A0A1D7W6W9_BREAU|nr:hypothetical protein BLSMQ_3084 [Brevibacterium aurantiacum]